MTPFPKRRLAELIAEHGRSLCNDPRRVDAMLTEDCPGHSREVRALVMALELQVVAELLTAAPDQEWVALAEPLARRLTGDAKLMESDAWTAVETWVQVLELPVKNAPFLPLESIEEVAILRELEGAGDFRRFARAGRQRGAFAGLLIAVFFSGLWAAAQGQPIRLEADENGVPPDFTWLLVPMFAAASGWVIGGVLGGALAGRSSVPLAGIITGGLIGLICGLIHADSVGKLFAGLMLNQAGQLLVGGLLGMVGGGFAGLVLDQLPIEADASS